MDIQGIVEAARQLPGIIAARAWTSVPGKERVYLETQKCNGGRNWNGGVGYSTCFIDINARAVVMRGEAGAATRNHHRELGTYESLKALVAAPAVNVMARAWQIARKGAARFGGGSRLYLAEALRMAWAERR
jgi:hypothetical protein